MKIGAKRDGTIVAVEGHFAYEAGAYPGSPYAAGARCAFGPYDIPNQYVEAWDVVLNKPQVAAYRAPGAPAAAFPVESLLDDLAERLEMDPIDLRLKNAAVGGHAPDRRRCLLRDRRRRTLWRRSRTATTTAPSCRARTAAAA